jgi:hypothetical protein
MSVLIAVSELIERVRIDCALPTFTTETNVTSDMVLDYIERGAQKLAALIQQNGADQQYLTLDTTLSVTANVATVSLPANTLDVIRIGIITSGSDECMLEPAPVDLWNPNPGLMSQMDWIVPRYSIQGNTITLYPTPTTARTLHVYYTVGFTVTSTADILSLRPNWDEYIVNWANTLVRMRQEKDAGDFVFARKEAEAAIVSQLKRDRAGPRQIRDVRAEWVGVGRRFGRWW